MTELQERLDLAVRLVREGGAHAMRYFQNTGLVIARKADDSPVTRADREAEELMRQTLDAQCPADAVLGEEHGAKDGTTGYRWYLDPVDGTEAFVRGVPLFGTMIGIEHAGEPVAGAICFPALGEIIYAARRSGAWWATGIGAPAEPLQPRQARVSPQGELSAACMSMTGLDFLDQVGKPDAFLRLRTAFGDSRGWSDCYGHYLVATGRVDAMIDPLMSVWDNAPLLPIIEEAGGRFTDIDGERTIHGGSALSTNGLLHDLVVEMLKA